MSPIQLNVDMIDANNFVSKVDTDALKDLLAEKGFDVEGDTFWIDAVGRIYVRYQDTARKQTIGVVNDDLSFTITKTPKKSKPISDRTCVSFYLSAADFRDVARAAAGKGENLSQFIRGIVLDHYKDYK